MASQLGSIQAFADAALSVASLSDLDMMMRETAAEFGADYYLMIHHTNYFDGKPGLVNLGNYPRELREISGPYSATICSNGGVSPPPDPLAAVIASSSRPALPILA